jgi:hypothetical protein
MLSTDVMDQISAIAMQSPGAMNAQPAQPPAQTQSRPQTAPNAAGN